MFSSLRLKLKYKLKNFLFNKTALFDMNVKDVDNIREKVKSILSQENSILDNYGFLQGTDKASVSSDYSPTGREKDKEPLFLTHDYLRHYDFFFQLFRDKKFNLLEFGCAGGSSLRTWKQYFPNAEIWGVDLNEDSKKLEEERINIFIGNAVSKNTFEELKNKINKAFIILDDASHAWSDQRRSFELFWDLVSPGGFYIIEDLECGALGAYPNYPPQVLDSIPFCDYMHDLSKILRWAPDREPTKNAYHFEHLPEQIQKIELEMDMCTFIPGAIIVRKKQ